MKSLILIILLTLLISPRIGFSSDNSASFDLKKVYEKLNLASFRNSTGPAREKGQKYFSHLGLPLSEISGDTLLVETEDWSYRVNLLKVRDMNRDGIIDAVICFTDKAKHATYNAQQPMLITQYYPGGDFVALKFEVEVDGCEEYAK